MLVAVGYSRVNEHRREIYEECKGLGYELISYVSSRASVWSGLDVGDNTFIFEDNTIQPFVKIGSNVVLWTGTHIGHDSTVGDHCFIAPRAAVSGNVSIGELCFVGVNATLRDGITVAPRCVIGAGALIKKDTAEGEVYSTQRTRPADVKSWELKDI
jgi:sugar O-acyltransferase (sialic acid O-acetyltransferase NeuD family)